MQKSETSQIQKIYSFDYVPATLKKHANGEWIIVYYIKINNQEKFYRKRKRVKKISPSKTRLKYAKKLVSQINLWLENKEFHQLGLNLTLNKQVTIHEAVQSFIDYATLKHQKNILRYDTLRSYKSFGRNYQKYLSTKKGLSIDFFTKNHVIEYIDHLNLVRNLNPRTVNNYLSNMNIMAVYLQEHGFIMLNPCSTIKKMKLEKKKREVIPKALLKNIFLTLEVLNMPYYTLCLMTYFCFVRRTELTKLKVKHLNLYDRLLSIPPEVSKNKKVGHVTIPNAYIDKLANHLNQSTNEDYIFSADNFKPGTRKLNPKKISDTWSIFRKQLEFDKKYQFYSLKDTGITELFNYNIPLIKIRDQARHHDINITELYTPRKNKADETIKNIDYDL